MTGETTVALEGANPALEADAHFFHKGDPLSQLSPEDIAQMCDSNLRDSPNCDWETSSTSEHDRLSPFLEAADCRLGLLESRVRLKMRNSRHELNKVTMALLGSGYGSSYYLVQGQSSSFVQHAFKASIGKLSVAAAAHTLPQASSTCVLPLAPRPRTRPVIMVKGLEESAGVSSQRPSKRARNMAALASEEALAAVKASDPGSKPLHVDTIEGGERLRRSNNQTMHDEGVLAGAKARPDEGDDDEESSRNLQDKGLHGAKGKENGVCRVVAHRPPAAGGHARKDTGKTLKLQPGSYTLQPRLQRGALRLRQVVRHKLTEG